jgi:FkbM family methyltransferase
MKPLSEKILEYLNFENGFYIECGANDGVTQSNTLTLEKKYNWNGILIEPSVVKYKECLNNRNSKNIILNCALVSNEYKQNTIKGDFNGHLMSSVGGVRLKSGLSVEVEAKTLTSILDKYNVKNIDFFSLDVEGYEINVLKGLDFKKYKPNYILIEVYDFEYEEIYQLMTEKNYELIKNLSDFNLTNNPAWDGTHNDYLFKYINDK